MNRRMTATVLVVAMLAAPHYALTEASRVRRYELPNMDSLELVVPPAWDQAVEEPPGGNPPTIQLHPHEGPPFEILITPEWVDQPAQAIPDSATLREQVRDAAERTRDQSTNKNVVIRSLQGTGGAGFYFTAIEPAPKPDEFKYMNQGVLQLGDLTLRFTILTNDGQDSVIEDAFAMLKRARHRRTGHDQS